jgi:sulfoxide reductase heme-binding subunit YedZ
MLVLLMGVPPFVVRERSIFTGVFSSSLLARTTGDVATVLLALTLLIGPANLLLRRRNPISSYLRRDVGVWAAVLSAAHVMVGFQVRGETRLFSFGSYFIADGRPLTDSFGLGNWTGLAALVLVAGLLAISTDRSVRELKAVRWKNLQRLNYTLFGLVIAHAIFYGALSQTTSPFTRFLFSTIASVFVGQAAGIWCTGGGDSGRCQRGSKPLPASPPKLAEQGRSDVRFYVAGSRRRRPPKAPDCLRAVDSDRAPPARTADVFASVRSPGRSSPMTELRALATVFEPPRRSR